MVEFGATPVSPISGPGGSKGRGGAREAVQDFLKYTVDMPDLEKAKLRLTRRSVESGSFNAASVPPGSSYTLGAEEADELGARIPVSVKSPSEGGLQEMTIQVVVMEEEGAWKIDLPATMERMLGGAMSAMGDALGNMGEAMASAMSGVGEALTAGMGQAWPEAKDSAAKVTQATGRQAKKAGKAVVASVKKAVKAASPSVKKRLKKIVKAGKRMMKGASTSPKGKRAKAKPAKRAASKPKPARKAKPTSKKKRR